MGDPTASRCLVSRRSRATTTSGTCWTGPRQIFSFAETMDLLGRTQGGLDGFRRLGDRLLIALDGTEYHASKSIHCQHCSSRLRGKAKDATEYFHAMLAATLVASGHDKVVPLEPEFIVPQDGAESRTARTRRQALAGRPRPPPRTSWRCVSWR